VFLDNVVTSVIVFEGYGEVSEYVGGYSDWLAYSQAKQKEQAKASKKQVKELKSQATEGASKKKNLSYKDQKELTELPATIETLESKQAELDAQIADPAFYQQEQSAINSFLEELAKMDVDLQLAYARWDELEALTE